MNLPKKKTQLLLLSLTLLLLSACAPLPSTPMPPLSVACPVIPALPLALQSTPPPSGFFLTRAATREQQMLQTLKDSPAK